MEWVMPSMASESAVGKIIHRVNAPLIAGAVMLCPHDAVDHRVAHVDVGRCHVNLCPQRPGAVRKLPCPHARKQIKIFLHAIGCGRGCLCPAR